MQRNLGFLITNETNEQQVFVQNNKLFFPKGKNKQAGRQKTGAQSNMKHSHDVDT